MTTVLMTSVLLFCCSLHFGATQQQQQKPNATIGEPPPEGNGITLPPAFKMSQLRRAWDMVLSHWLAKHRFGRKSVCYDGVGCFHVSGKFSHLRSVPESPEQLDTKFYLFTRSQLMRQQRQAGDPEVMIKAEDKGENIGLGEAANLIYSDFDPQRPTKILLHGYHGRGDGASTRAIRKALLRADDSNVISVDWAQGARGPNYMRAVANAELVGRQLARLVMEMVNLGASPRDVHIIGFSLGAQVAGLAGATLKRQGLKIGRITGLDPASFMFEGAGLEADRRLDLSDAEFVDVIHTDGSQLWSDGFGLLGPVGHVDFFPNGGLDQPGCDDSYVGALRFQITRNRNSTGLCSHSRAVELFIESLDPQCRFVAFPCPGLRSFSRNFLHGDCFSCDGGSCGEMGPHAAEMPGRGPLYFVTRASKPYCGQQLRATVRLSPSTNVARGSLVMQLQHGKTVTSFELGSSRIAAQALDMITGGQELAGMSAARSRSVSPEQTPVLMAALSFRPRPGTSRFSTQRILIDQVTVISQEGNWWFYCGANTTLDYSRWEKTMPLVIQLTMKRCVNPIE